MITDQASFTLTAHTSCEFLLVEVPMLVVSAQTDAAIKGDVRVTSSEYS